MSTYAGRCSASSTAISVMFRQKSAIHAVPVGLLEKPVGSGALIEHADVVEAEEALEGVVAAVLPTTT